MNQRLERNKPKSIAKKNGIDIRENDDLGSGGYTNDSEDLDRYSNSCPASMDHHNTNSQKSETNQSFTNSNKQIRKAASTSANASTINLSQVSQPTLEAMNQFFYDEPDLPYHPPPPHELEDSPCKSIIRFDNRSSLYNCTLHPDVQNYHLESIEHHIKYENPEMHKSEILKMLEARI